MMLSLSLAALMMLLLSTICLFWPRKSGIAKGQTRLQQFEERLQLLAAARDNGELAEADFDSAAAELKQQFANKSQAVVSGKRSWRLPLLLLLILSVMVVAVYGLTGHYRQLADWEMAQQQLQQLGERALLGQGEPLSEHEIDLFALGLRTKLAKDGDDAVAWMLLGRVRMSQGALEEAVTAFERALRMTPERIPLLLSYSQALIMLADDASVAKAGRVVAWILSREPANTDALSLMALIAYEKGDMAEATSAWQLLLKQLPQDDPRYAAVQQRLQELGAALPAGRHVRVTLNVSPALKQTHPDATLFLFARAAHGAQLPLAVQRIALPEGKVSLLLTEQMAMQSGWSLASVDQIQVVARMSLAGTVEQRPGDVQTESDILTFFEPQLTVDLTLEPRDE